MEKVANPSEILLFRKRVERTAKDEGYELESELMETIMARNLANCTSMEDLIGQYFSQTEDKNQLQLLGIKSIGTAVKAFIDKEDKDAVNVIVENQVRSIFTSQYLLKQFDRYWKNFHSFQNTF
jgi:double-strand break repair protein MRE11